jgi:hypothetical protein
MHCIFTATYQIATDIVKVATYVFPIHIPHSRGALESDRVLRVSASDIYTEYAADQSPDSYT